MSTEDEKLLKEAKKLPWDERLLHKNWKVRNDANIDLAGACDSITDPKDPRLREFGPLFRKTVADSNAPVQEKALDALIAFQRAADADAGRFAKEVCDAIVAKCLTGRPKTVEKSQAAFLLWVGLEAAEVFLESMEKAIKHKVPKVVVQALDVIFQALNEFGAKVVPPKKILKMLPDLFDHQDQNVRASSKGLTLELCRWIGKDPKKEMEAELANVTGIARLTRKIRSEQDKEPEQEASVEVTTGVSEESAPDGPQEIDEYELVDPVDILTPLEKTRFWDGVKATKWSERRDAVAELTKLSSTIKIAPGDFTEISRILKKLVTDVNLAVSVEAIQAIGNLASGLRNHFAGSSCFLLPALLEKLKEKKQVVTEALTQTLQNMHKAGCLSLADVTEDIKVAVKNKVPLVRSSTLSWVIFCIETSNKTVVLKLHEDYVPICMECLNDVTPEVRDASFSVLAAIAKMVGMSPLERSLEKLDEVRKKKLSEMIGSSGSGVVSTTGSVLATNSSESSVQEATDTSFVRRSAASLLSGKRPVQAASTTKKGGSAKPAAAKKADDAGQSKALASAETEDIEPGDMSLEEIEARLNSVIPADAISQLKSGVWKERLEDPCYVAFHDEEWGVPVHDDRKLFELLVLSGALAELTWPAILSKRHIFRELLMDFDPISISKLNEKKLLAPGSTASSLLSEPKLCAIVENARQTLKIIEEFGSFDEYCWSFVNYKPITNGFRYSRQVPVKTPKADVISKDLVRRGFRSVGPTVIYCFMQVAGITNDHLIGCYRFNECAAVIATTAANGTTVNDKDGVKANQKATICQSEVRSRTPLIWRCQAPWMVSKSHSN